MTGVIATATAFAKVNLALHVRRRREDGYHELETLFAFVDDGDTLELLEGPEGDGGPSLELTGEFAPALAGDDDNLVLAVARMLDRAPAFRLDKRLPVAAGLGGGSSDAAAAARLLVMHSGAERNAPLATLGADIPACIDARTVIGVGTGTDLKPVKHDDLRGAPILLVNPRVPLSTGPVFKAWDGVDRGALPDGSAEEIALAGRNDLEVPAIRLCPVIADVLSALREMGPWLARMSGSGATCFALFDEEEQRDAADAVMHALHPKWWTMAGKLR